MKSSKVIIRLDSHGRDGAATKKKIVSAARSLGISLNQFAIQALEREAGRVRRMTDNG